MELNVTFLIQSAAFLLTVAVLSNVLFAPVLAMLDERTRRIEGARKEAAQLAGAADVQAGTIAARLAEARSTGHEELNRLKALGEQAEREQIDAARAEGGRWVDAAKQGLVIATAVAKEQLHKDAGTLAAAIAHKALGRNA